MIRYTQITLPLLAQVDSLSRACHTALEDGEFARSPAGRRLAVALTEFENEMATIRRRNGIERRCVEARG